MDSVLQKRTQSKSNFFNWIKAALAVLVTKKELEPVAHDEILQFKQKCLQDISTSNSLPSGSACSNCYTENIVVCRTNRICNVKHGNCLYHSKPATKYRPSGCPNKICHNLNCEIQKAHRFHGPSYKNTDATRWCSDAWEVAKCFMPPDGYKDVTSAAETDFNGIISVFINYKGFDAKIEDDLSKPGNIFDKGREVGKAVRHCPNLEIEDADLAQYLTILNNILIDPGFNAINKSPHDGSQKLAQLQNDDFIIGKDIICNVLDDERKATQERMINKTDECKYQTDVRQLELINLINRKVKDIEDQGNVSLAQLNETVKSSIDALEAKTQASIQAIKVATEQGTQKLEEEGDRIKKEKENALREIKQAKEVSSHDTGADIHTSEEMYNQRKQEFRENLTKFYKRERSTVPLSPLVEEIETHLVGFYVMPNLVSIKQKSLTSDQEERTPVKSLRDLFVTRGEDQQEIYLSALAGFGKTSFSKYLAITWAQACYPDIDQKCFKDEELKAVVDFEFLFLLLLRDSTAVCSIDEMIEQQIIKKLPTSASGYLLQEVLRKEKCLIILDGLDEWTHPENGCPEQKEKIPCRCVRDKCVILTTTRPWKLSTLKTRVINKKLELVQLNQSSTRQLEKNAIRKMSDVHDDDVLEDKRREFDQIVADHGLKQMHTIPLLLMYVLCLWCNEIPLGYSKMEIYVDIIEFLLSRTANKHPDVYPSSGTTNSDIPEYLKECNFCKKYFYFLEALAKLAYHTLFNEKRENTLVFDGLIAENYLKSDELKFSLLSGILSESTTKTLVKRTSKVSFSHKTVQEFFAAIFISSQSDALKTVQERCKTVQSILDISMVCEFMSKMNFKMMCAISADFMSVINEDDETSNYRNRTWSEVISKNPLYNIQEMFLSCFKEMPESETIPLCLQDFFIDEDTIYDKHLKRLTKINNANMKSLYIDTEDISYSFGEIVESYSLTDLTNLQKLYYNGAMKNADIHSLPSLQTLTLSSTSSTNYEGNLGEQLGSLKGLNYLYIRCLTLSHKYLEKLISFISGRTTMGEVTLWGLSCTEHGHNCMRLDFDLSEHPQLKKLVLRQLPPLQLNLTTPSLVNVTLYRINIGEKSILLSRDMLNIEHVEFEYIELSAASFLEFIEVLEGLPHSVTVDMKRCDIKPKTEYGGLKNRIQSSEHFVITCDKSWKFEFKTLKPNKE